MKVNAMDLHWIPFYSLLKREVHRLYEGDSADRAHTFYQLESLLLISV